MTVDWRRLSQDAREREYNPRAALGEGIIADHLATYAKRADEARERLRGRYDIRCGKRPKQTFDLFSPSGNGGPRPALIFVHGGYWRAMDKSDVSFVLEPVVKAGVVGVAANYDLCPEVTLDVIVEEMREMLAFIHSEAMELGIDRDEIYLAGHSAGAHLAAMLLHEDVADVIKGAVLVSGIYEPEIVRHISVNDDVRLTEEMARRNDCLSRPPAQDVPLVVTVGGAEPEGWIGQSEAYVAACHEAGIEADLFVVAGIDHFALLHEPLIPEDAAGFPF